MENLGIDGKIILKQALKKYSGIVSAGYIWLDVEI